MTEVVGKTYGLGRQDSEEDTKSFDKTQSQSESTRSFGVEPSEEEDSESDDAGFTIPADARHLAVLLKLLNGKEKPQVPERPALPDPPVHFKKIPHRLLAVQKNNTQFARMMNSSVGRATTFCLSTVIFVFADYSLVQFQDPVRLLNGTHAPMMIAAFVAVLLFYVCMPTVSEKAGMFSKTSGWKPYMAIYRLAYIVAVPAFTCLALGMGGELGFGQKAATRFVANLDAVADVSRYFEAKDGYVALNLTKGIVETAVRTQHGEKTNQRASRFRNAQLFVNKEPFTGIVEPTVPPGAIQMYAIAPIFSQWAECMTRYEISPTCLEQHFVVAWAIARENSICTGLKMVACNHIAPELKPVYRCSTEAVDGRASTGAIQGLCGRVVLNPGKEIIDEFASLLVTDGWPRLHLPNISQPWIDVTPDDCISHPDECQRTWRLLGNIGVAFSVLTLLCIIFPAVIDWQVDKRIREVRKFWDRH